MNEQKTKINSYCKIIKKFFRNERELLNAAINFSIKKIHEQKK
jgi:hypothetical protein